MGEVADRYRRLSQAFADKNGLLAFLGRQP